MVNRINVLSELVSVASLTAKQQSTVNDGLEKAITSVLPTTSFSDVKNLKCVADVEILIGDILNASALANLSKAWEPARKTLDREQKANLKHDITALLQGKRQPYEKLGVSLDVARGLDADSAESLRHDIKRIAPATDLAALVKKWDPHFPKKLKSRSELVPHLIDLLDAQSQPHLSKTVALSALIALTDKQKEIAVSQIEKSEDLKVIQARLKKLDKHLDASQFTKSGAVAHLRSLVFGEIAPTSKPKRVAKKKA